MDIVHTLKKIVADIKALDVDSLQIEPDKNFIESMGLDSFQIVNLVDRIDETFKINFGSEADDFDALKTWPTLVDTIKNKLST